MKKSLITLFTACALFFSVTLFATPVDINNADATMLAQVMKGVGKKKANAIIAYREQHGGFISIEELTNVKGIGAKTLQRNIDNLTINTNK